MREEVVVTVEWNASEYARNSTLQQTLAEENLARLTLDGTEKILDIGCGDGKVTAGIAARVPEGSVLGIDASTAMIAFAQRTYVRPNLAFAVGDARSLPYRDTFDLVVSFYALHWVREQDVALRAIRAALKLGGKAFLQFVGESERPSLEDVIEEVRKTAAYAGFFPGFEQPFAHFTPGQYARLAEESGLRVRSIHCEDKRWDFRTRAAFAGFCRGTFVTWTRHLPEEQREGFIHDVLDRYQARVAETPAEAHTFKFLQMEVSLIRES